MGTSARPPGRSGDSSSKRPFPLPTRSPGKSFQKPHTVTQRCGANSGEAGQSVLSMLPWRRGVSQLAARLSPLARLAQRSQEVLKGKTTGMGSPHRGSKVSPDLGPNNRLMRISTRRSVGPAKAPSPVLQGKRNESLAAEQRRSASQPVRRKKRKSFIKEASWPSKCLKAGWWMRRSASTGPIRRVTGARAPIAASARKMFSRRS
jgi:hypothetical protein